MTRTRSEVEKVVTSFGYILLEEYSGKGDKKRVSVTDNWGYKYNVFLGSIIYGSTLDFVSTWNPNSLENISLWLKWEEKQFELCDGNEYKGATERLWFHCLNSECNIDFDTTWNEIYSQSRGCPYCSRQRLSNRNKLSVIYPSIASEWDYNKNEDTPDDVAYASNGGRWWICPNGHDSYFAIVASRTISGTGCPLCADKQTESKIATGLKQWCLDNFYYADVEHRMFKNSETGRWLKCDIYLGESGSTNGVYIEVHGRQHFKLCLFHKLKARQSGKTPEKEFEDSQHRDKIKKKFAKKNGIYIEIDLRKIKTTEDAIEYVENIISKL